MVSCDYWVRYTGWRLSESKSRLKEQRCIAAFVCCSVVEGGLGRLPPFYS
jgi:hypothetical protein